MYLEYTYIFTHDAHGHPLDRRPSTVDKMKTSSTSKRSGQLPPPGSDKKKQRMFATDLTDAEVMQQHPELVGLHSAFHLPFTQPHVVKAKDSNEILAVSTEAIVCPAVEGKVQPSKDHYSRLLCATCRHTMARRHPRPTWLPMSRRVSSPINLRRSSWMHRMLRLRRRLLTMRQQPPRRRSRRVCNKNVSWRASERRSIRRSTLPRRPSMWQWQPRVASAGVHALRSCRLRRLRKLE